MSSNIKKQNIYSQVSRVYPTVSYRLRMIISAKEYRNKNKSDSMESLHKRFLKSKSDTQRLSVLRNMSDLYHAPDDIPKTEDEIIQDKSLADFVFKYYRHKFMEEMKSDNTILLHESFQLLHLVYENPDDINIKERWISLVVASTQLGKTFLMFALSNIFLALGYCPVFIVKDIFQKNQFLSRKETDSKELQNFLKIKDVTSKDLQLALTKHGKFSKENIDLFGEPLYQDSTTKNPDTINNIEAALNGTRRRIILCIWNEVHIERIYNNIQANSKIVLFVDEAHKLGAYKCVTQDSTELTGNINCKYDNMYLRIKVHAEKIFLFTATPQPIIATEPNLYTGSIVIMPEGVNYRGIETWDFSEIPEIKEEDYLERHLNIKGNKIKAKIPCSFLSEIAKLSDKPMIYRTNKFGIKDYHPLNVMAKFEITNNGHLALLNCFKQHPFSLNKDHKKIIAGNWTVMTLNQKGVLLYHRSLIGKTITIKGKNYQVDMAGECLFPKSIAIGDVWHWLWLNDISKFGRMITIAYKSAEEGLTFCSSWGTSPENDGNIHLTHFYSHAGASISAASLEQSTGRMNGNHGDKMSQPPLVFCPLSEKEKLLKSVNLHRQMLKNICDMKLEHDDSKVIDHIHGYEVFNNLIPKKYYGEIQGASKFINKLVNPMAEMEDQAFKSNTKAGDIMAIINPELDDGKKRTDEIKLYNETNGKNESKGNCTLIPTTCTNYKKITEHIQNTYGLGVWVNMILLKDKDYKIIWNCSNKISNLVINSTPGLLLRNENFIQIKYDV